MQVSLSSFVLIKKIKLFLMVALIGAPTIIGGIVLIIVLSIESAKGAESANWPSIQGSIVKSHWQRSSPKKASVSNIVYTYSIQGKEYTSGRVNFSFFNDHEELLKTFQKGHSTRVYYNPQNLKEKALSFLDNI